MIGMKDWGRRKSMSLSLGGRMEEDYEPNSQDVLVSAYSPWSLRGGQLDRLH